MKFLEECARVIYPSLKQYGRAKVNGAVTGSNKGKGNVLCAGNTILTMQRNAQGNLEGISVIFTMQVEPGTVAVLPGLIERMQA